MQTKKQIFFEILRFLIVGGIATISDYAVFYFCNLVVFKNINEYANLILSTFLGFTTGLIVNWVLQRFVYRYLDNEITKNKKVFLKFLIVSLIGLGMTELGINLASPLYGEVYWHIIFKFDFWKLFFKMLMTVIVLIWNYLARKFYVFKVKKDDM